MKPGIALVNDTYTADCIRFRSTVDVRQSRFQVSGAQPTQNTHEQESSGKTSSSFSLPLKRPGRKGSPPIATPPRAGEDVGQSLDCPEFPTNEENRQADLKINHGDLLEDLIEEVKGSEVIVRMIVLVCSYTCLRI